MDIDSASLTEWLRAPEHLRRYLSGPVTDPAELTERSLTADEQVVLEFIRLSILNCLADVDYLLGQAWPRPVEAAAAMSRASTLITLAARLLRGHHDIHHPTRMVTPWLRAKSAFCRTERPWSDFNGETSS